MNICFFTHHELDWGSSKERVGLYLPFLQKRNHQYTIISVAPHSLTRIILGKSSFPFILRFFYSTFYNRILRCLKFFWIIQKAKKFDLIFIQKVNMPQIFIKMLRRRNKNIVFDFDDLCFFIPSQDTRFFQKIRLQWNFIQHPSVLKLFKHIIAGNSYLADIVKEHTHESNVTILPTAIDCSVYYPLAQKGSSHPPIIGWIGSGENHLKHLKLLVSPLEQISKRFSFQFVLVGALNSKKIKSLFQSSSYPSYFINWLNTDELAKTIRTFDIGVMPLVDDAESKGKCGFKALAYMASGIATIVSPVGVNTSIVQDGMNGFWAKDELQWIEKLVYLLSDSLLRQRLGQEGRKTVEHAYSLENTSKIFIKTLETQSFLDEHI